MPLSAGWLALHCDSKSGYLSGKKIIAHLKRQQNPTSNEQKIESMD